MGPIADPGRSLLSAPARGLGAGLPRAAPNARRDDWACASRDAQSRRGRTAAGQARAGIAVHHAASPETGRLAVRAHIADLGNGGHAPAGAVAPVEVARAARVRGTPSADRGRDAA